MTRCQADMEHLRRELDHAHRCVNDLEVNLMVAGEQPEADQDPSNNEFDVELKLYRLREENGRLRTQVSDLQREVLTVRSRQLELLLHSPKSDNNRAMDVNCNHSDSNGVVADERDAIVAQLQHELRQTRESLIGEFSGGFCAWRPFVETDRKEMFPKSYLIPLVSP
uniref:Uncharacterized protein n=1 Tax=Plectus sambesii TaxID=2011161 RepID=A0A914XHN5_9BILA